MLQYACTLGMRAEYKQMEVKLIRESRFNKDRDNFTGYISE